MAYWVTEWDSTGEVISTPVARKIAEYWQSSGDGVLAAFASGATVDGEAFRDDIEGTICYAKTAGTFDKTIHELYALKAWAVRHCAIGA